MDALVLLRELAENNLALKKVADMIAEQYAKLPVDADGKTWHVGDVLEDGQTVGSMGLNGYGWCFIGTRNHIDPALHHHYKPQTVGDVLREFALACEDAGNAGPEVERIAAEYAAKLRLVEEAGA